MVSLSLFPHVCVSVSLSLTHTPPRLNPFPIINFHVNLHVEPFYILAPTKIHCTFKKYIFKRI